MDLGGIDLPSASGTGNFLAITSGAVVGIFLTLKKVLKISASDTVDTKSSEAHASVISMMHSELERMNKVNEELAKRVNDFQLENIRLRGDTSQLTELVKALKAENISLREEVKVLTQRLHELNERLLDRL